MDIFEIVHRFSAASHVRFSPHERTSTSTVGMSAKGQQRKSAWSREADARCQDADLGAEALDMVVGCSRDSMSPLSRGRG
jgi:hypothetical protein